MATIVRRPDLRHVAGRQRGKSPKAHIQAHIRATLRHQDGFGSRPIFVGHGLFDLIKGEFPSDPRPENGIGDRAPKFRQRGESFCGSRAVALSKLPNRLNVRFFATKVIEGSETGTAPDRNP